MEMIGKWVNQNGSILEISEADGNTLRGSFISTKGRAVQGTKYPMQGIVNDELISFAVNFIDANENRASIATFSGRFTDDDSPKLHTIWIVARQFEDAAKTKPTQLWNTFLTNSDTFTRIDT